MRREKEIPTIEYSDEQNDDFAGIKREAIRVGADFPYLPKSRLWNFAAFVVYRIIMTPFAFLYSKLKLGLRIVNRKAIREVGRQGCFLYSNHTLMAGDAFIPNLVSFPRRTYVVVNAENLSARGTRNWVQMSGALPIPTELSGMRAFLDAVETRIGQGYCVQIYPEAHIWPYYTGIRNFSAASFRYPVRLNAPVYCTTTTFQRRRIGKRPRVTVYVDGPFYPNPALHPRQREKDLRDRVYETMCQRAQQSSYEAVKYVKKEEQT